MRKRLLVGILPVLALAGFTASVAAGSLPVSGSLSGDQTQDRDRGEFCVPDCDGIPDLTRDQTQDRLQDGSASTVIVSTSTSTVPAGDPDRIRLQDGSCEDCDGTPDRDRMRDGSCLEDGTTVAVSVPQTPARAGTQAQVREMAQAQAQAQTGTQAQVQVREQVQSQTQAQAQTQTQAQAQTQAQTQTQAQAQPEAQTQTQAREQVQVQTETQAGTGPVQAGPNPDPGPADAGGSAGSRPGGQAGH